MRVALLLCALLVVVYAGDSATVNNANQWLSTHSDITITNLDANTVQFNLAQWIWGDHGGDTFYMYIKPNQIPPFVQGGDVNLKFDFWQDSGNTYYPESGFDTSPHLKIYAVTNLPSDTSRWSPDPIFYNNMCWYDDQGPCKVVFSGTVTYNIPWGSSNSLHVDLTMLDLESVNVWDSAQFVVELILNEKPSRASGNNYYLSNIHWSIDDSPNDYSTLSLVDARKWTSSESIIQMSNPSSTRLRLQYPQWAYGVNEFTW